MADHTERLYQRLADGIGRRILQAVMLDDEQTARQAKKCHLFHIRNVAHAPIEALREA